MGLARMIQSGGYWQGCTVYQVDLTAAMFADNTVVDVGDDLPDAGLVTDCLLVVDTPETTATTKEIDVGIINAGESGDEDGFLDGVSVAAAGMVYPTLVNATPTRGAYLRTVSGEAGEHCREPYTLDGTKKSIAVTCKDAGGFTEFAGRLLFFVLHDGAARPQAA